MPPYENAPGWGKVGRCCVKPTPPPNWPFPTYKGQPIKQKRQRKPAYPVAPDAPF